MSYEDIELRAFRAALLLIFLGKLLRLTESELDPTIRTIAHLLWMLHH